jgi:hypothetical protein
MEKQLIAIIDDGLGNKETYQGTREEIESLLEKHLDPNLISLIITDETGVTVGRKVFGVSEIAWGCGF